MKQRVITGLVWGVVAVITLILISYPLMGILIAFFSAVAVHEIENVAKVKNKPIIILSVICAGLTPFLIEYKWLDKLHISQTALIIAYIIILLSFMLAKYEITKFEHVAIVVFSSLAVPYALSVLLLLRDVYKTFPNAYQKQHGFYFVFLALSCAWITDIFAYFIGRKFGKHKMSPKISPKKSVEGAVGGIVITAVFNFITLLVFTKFYFAKPIMSYWVIIPVSVVLSIIGMLGDLSASVIKRNYGEKDFGTIMPGHGGIMDRFDSCLFVFPALYAFILMIQKF